MITFPHCKINIGLQVLSRRKDGFHDIATLFYPLPLCDVLEVLTTGTTIFEFSGIPIPGSPQDNLCLKAYQLLKKDFEDLPAVAIHLHKAVPIGAGLGGGSSDGAFMLKLLNDKYQLGLPAERLSALASALGSDCNFFLQDSPRLATGKGGELSPCPGLDLRGYFLVLIYPDIHVDTAWAYSRIVPATPDRPLAEMLDTPVGDWKGRIVNDFEAPVFQAYPLLAQIKETLYQKGALYASMSGSGSSLFGLFAEKIDIRPLQASLGKSFVWQLPG